MHRSEVPLRLVPAESTDLAVAPLSLDVAFRQYSAYVAGVATWLLGRDEDVDDEVQSVFVIATRGMGRIRRVGAFKSWLARVTVRTATRKLRRGRQPREALAQRDRVAYRPATAAKSLDLPPR